MTEALNPRPEPFAEEDPRRQMLRLVTRSFCREILNYGVSARDLVRVSSHVLEYATAQAAHPRPGGARAFGKYGIDDILALGEGYELRGVTVRPFSDDHLSLAAEWVSREDIRNSMLVAYPTDAEKLRRHMRSYDRAYHVIFFQGEPVGLIGAEDIDRHSRRLEMRKLVGRPGLRGRGIGTRATFLWLHHIFDTLGFNKVYIHTHDTNVRNINLNRSLGFELEGVLPEERLLRGRYVDILRMGLLRKKWIASTRPPAPVLEGVRESRQG